jgi:hypothetical protein
LQIGLTLVSLVTSPEYVTPIGPVLVVIVPAAEPVVVPVVAVVQSVQYTSFAAAGRANAHSDNCASTPAANLTVLNLPKFRMASPTVGVDLF